MQEDYTEQQAEQNMFVEEEQHEESLFIPETQTDTQFMEEISEELLAENADSLIEAPNKTLSALSAERKQFPKYSDYDIELEPEEEEVHFSVPITDKVTSPFFKKMILEKHPIVAHIIQYNMRKAHNIHPSHYMNSGDLLFKNGCMDIVLNSRRAGFYFTRHLHDLVGSSAPQHIWFTDFEAYQHRFALLSGTLLQELSVYLGMMIFHAKIRKTIQQEGVVHLRTIFGKKMTDFGVRRVPLFLHNVDSLYNLFCLPPHWNIEDLIRESGRYGLGLCVSTLPTQLQKDIVLKLPKAFLSSDEYEPDSIGTEDFSTVQKKVLSNKLFPLLRKILTLEVAPEWTPFFF